MQLNDAEVVISDETVAVDPYDKSKVSSMTRNPITVVRGVPGIDELLLEAGRVALSKGRLSRENWPARLRTHK